jgi:WD40 repeat protein
LREFAGRVFNVAFTPDGTQIATSVDGEIKLWDVSTGKGGLTFEGWNRFSFSPNGKQIAAGTSNSKVKIWDAATGKELLTLTGDTSAILCVAFSPDGEQIAAASWYKFVIVVWDLDTIAPADSLEAPKAP